MKYKQEPDLKLIQDIDLFIAKLSRESVERHREQICQIDKKIFDLQAHKETEMDGIRSILDQLNKAGKTKKIPSSMIANNRYALNSISQKQHFISGSAAKNDLQIKSVIKKFLEENNINCRAYLDIISFSSKKRAKTLSIRLENHVDEYTLVKYIDEVSSKISTPPLEIQFLTRNEELKNRTFCYPFYTSPSFQIENADFTLFTEDGHHSVNCTILNELSGPGTEGALLCEISDQTFSDHSQSDEKTNQVILIPTHSETSMNPIENFPCEVSIAIPSVNLSQRTKISENNYRVISRATIAQKEHELYKENMQKQERFPRY